MRIQSLSRVIVIAFLLSACAPGTSATTPPSATTEPSAAAPATQTLAAPPVGAETESASTEAAAALPVATSRGPGLHATDPAGVSLASGGLQFVEFFRFT